MQKAKSGIKVSSERWDPVSQMWVIDDGSYKAPASSLYKNDRNNGIVPQEQVPFSMMENPYGGVFNEQQSPTFYKPYNQVNYDGILTPNYMRTEFNPQTNKWDKVSQVDKVELQPQYTGDWSNAQRKSFEAQQPSQIGAYKTTKGKRKSNYSTEYDDVYKNGGVLPIAEDGYNWGQYSYFEQPKVPAPYTAPQQYTSSAQPSSNNSANTASAISAGMNKAADFMDNISSHLQNATKNVIIGGNMLAMNVLGNKQRDERLDRPYQKPVDNQFAFGTGSQAIAKNGMSIPYENGGTLDNTTIHKGGNAELISYNPYTPETIQYNGQSHDNGGITIDYNGSPVEVEGGETQTGNIVFGNMKIPGTKTKFKDASKQLAAEERKSAKILSKGEELLSIDQLNAYRTLKTNSGKILTEVADKKLQEAAKTKQELALVQDAMLKSKEQNKKMKDGGEIEIAKSGWKFNNTSYEGVDPKIKKFVELVEEKGYTGYSGPKSGVSERNTKSGRKSRHAVGDALDMMFDDPFIYSKILQDKELTSYLYSNGLTALNEYDPNIAKKTGATVGHLHIGFDKGTPVADKFRHDATLFHPELKNKKPPFIPKPYKGGNTPIKNAPVGDVHEAPEISILPTVQPINQIKKEDFANWYTQQFQPNVYNQNVSEEPFKGPSNFDYLKSIGNPTISPEQPVKKLPSLADSNKLSFAEIAPEVGTLLSNIQGADFVQGQEYNPTLYTPYQVSFQDRINENNAQLKAMERMVPNNPSALSTLAAQAYQANNAVAAEQFRTNQGITNDIINKNVSIINDAEARNLALRDQQYARQAQAEANTKQQIFDAMSSISNKYSKNKKENVDIRLKETMFPNYRPSQDGKYEMEFNGEKWLFDPMSQTMTPLSKKKQEVTEVDEEGNKKTKTTYEKSNNMINKKWGGWI